MIFVVTFYCLELIKVSGQISPLWFSAGLITMVVFRNPRRTQPLLLLGCVLGVACAMLFEALLTLTVTHELGQAHVPDLPAAGQRPGHLPNQGEQPPPRRPRDGD